MKIKNIVIVGGGSSGWMTASAIAHNLPEINLTLIESPNIPNIGVGESTLGHINRFFRLLDLTDQDWMKECSATYKNSIQFTNFHKIGTRFQYPFGGFVMPPDDDKYKYSTEFDIPIFLDLQRLFPEEISCEDFVRFYNINSLLAEYNKQTTKDVCGFDFFNHTAYHLDADALAIFLKNRYSNRITHILDEVNNIECNELGITKIISTNHTLTADLFIDCTGFKSLLIEKTLDVDWYQFPHLPNNKAVTARIPYTTIEDQKNSIHNVTDCKALSSGWLWDIPLWKRKGAGYVYSSEFLTKDQAEEEFRKETGWNDNVNHISFRHGYHKKAFHKNVLAIGLSYGFIEPLESTGLLTTHENIIKFIKLMQLHEGHVNKLDKILFNTSCETQMSGLSDFVGVHYALSRRDDTPYWNYVTNEIDQSRYEYDLHVKEENIAQSLHEIFTFDRFDPRKEGMFCILMGNNYNPAERVQFNYSTEQLKNINFKKNFIIDSIKSRIDFVKNLPSSYDFLYNHIYK